MRINHNIAALNTYRQLSINSTQANKSLEKLSSGLRINRAGDDAAGLSISEKMRGQIRGLDQASRNAQDGISLIQTAEGALQETHSILQRMRELAVQSANDTNESTDRTAIQSEVTALIAEVDRIGNDTEFNEKKLLSGNLGGGVNAGTATTAWDVVGVASITTTGATTGTYTFAYNTATSVVSIANTAGTTVNLTVAADSAQTISIGTFGLSVVTTSGFGSKTSLAGVTINVTSGSATFHIGANKDQAMQLSINDMRASALGIAALDISTRTAANDAITTVNTALTTVSTQRSNLGAMQNRLEHTINNLNAASENLVAAESRIRDVDMASEMMAFTKNNILMQAAQAMLAQANQQPQGVLQLLR